MSRSVCLPAPVHPLFSLIAKAEQRVRNKGLFQGKQKQTKKQKKKRKEKKGAKRKVKKGKRRTSGRTKERKRKAEIKTGPK